MKINCLSCGHKLDLGDAYDDYAGQVRCLVCGAMLEVRTEEGHVKSAAVTMRSGALATGARENTP
jgi:DNA-directed RNA polymerase subunit N (RpoN/RPB10)